MDEAVHDFPYDNNCKTQQRTLKTKQPTPKGITNAEKQASACQALEHGAEAGSGTVSGGRQNKYHKNYLKERFEMQNEMENSIQEENEILAMQEEIAAETNIATENAIEAEALTSDETNTVIKKTDTFADAITSEDETANVTEDGKEKDNDSFLKKSLGQTKQETLSSFMGLSAFKSFQNIPNTRGGNGVPSVGIVYTPRNGKRLSISNALFDLLGQPKQLAIAFTDTQLALGSELPMNAQKYPFSPDKYTHIIYRSAVVHQIIKQFGLDFSDVTSKSYTDVCMDSFTNELGFTVPVAIVTMK